MTKAQQTIATILTSVCACATSVTATASNFDRVLEAASGDRVTILLETEKRQTTDGVALCLFDGTADNTEKAFDIRVAGTPRFWTAGDHNPVCGSVSDTAQTVSFFTRSGSGEALELMRTRLDLIGLAGRRINLVWTVSDP